MNLPKVRNLREVEKEPMSPFRKKEFYQGGYFHIYNRGANQDLIFFNPDNFLYCLQLLGKYKIKYKISIIGYCLMPNHYHLLIRQDASNGISEFMRDVFNSYVQAVNLQQRRKGTLFQGRFRHIQIEKDEHILHLCRYIHLNPVKAGLTKLPEEWLYSNYLDWIGERKGILTDRSFMKDNFGNSTNYREFVMDYLQEKKAEKIIAKYMLD